MHATLQTFLLVLLVVAAVGALSQRLRIHANIALVVTGAALGASGLMPALALDPAIVLQVLLPILLFEAAISTDVGRLRENLAPVALLAGPGVLVAVAIGGGVLHLGLDLSWPLALLLAAVLAPTDTLAVLGAVRAVRAPARLAAIVENESLFNDGTALVAFTTLLVVVQEGRFDPGHGLVELVWVVGGGLAVGGMLGRAAGLVYRHTRDHLMEILVSVIVAYGSAVLAERLHASPVLAVVAAGIAMVGASSWGAITPSGRVAIRSVWEVAAFGVNSVVFLLVGLQVDFPSLGAAVPAIGWGLLALFCARVVSVYPLLALLRTRGNGVPLSWQHLLVAGNLKGGLSMALALSLPAALPSRELLVAVVFGCAFVTLLGLGLTLTRIARALGIGGTGGAERELQLRQGRLLAGRAAQAELERLQQLGMVPPGVFQRLRAAYQGSIVRSERELRDLLLAHAGEEARQVQRLRQHLLQVEKSAVRDAEVSGMLGEEAAAELLAESDRGLAGP